MRAIKKEDLASINYYQVPKWLMELFIKKAISQGAFKTYVLMYDRVRLSAANGWIDKNGDVYIKYSYDEMQKELCCSRQTISDNLKDLVNCELIDKKKCFGASTIFYLNVSSLENLTSKENLDYQSSRKLDYSSLENLDANKNNVIKNNLNNNNNVAVNKSNVKSRDSHAIDIDIDIEKDNNNKEPVVVEKSDNAKEKNKFADEVLPVVKQEISMLIRTNNFNITPEKLLMYAKGDYNLVLQQFKYFNASLSLLIASIKDKYEPKIEEKKAEPTRRGRALN